MKELIMIGSKIMAYIHRDTQALSLSNLVSGSVKVIMDKAEETLVNSLSDKVYLLSLSSSHLRKRLKWQIIVARKLPLLQNTIFVVASLPKL